MANPEPGVSHRDRSPSNKLLAALFPAIITLVIAGCATQQSKLSAPPNAVADIADWQIRGKIGFRSATQSTSAYLNWLQLADAYTIRLNGPFGTGNLQIHGDASGVTFRRPGQPEQHAADAAQLLEQQVGWSIPIEHFHYWIRGLPAAVPIDQQSHTGEQLVMLNQAGWLVEYLRYEQFANFLLPTKLRLQHDDLQVTVIIKKWRLDDLRSNT